jgi:predicted MFS family arabinose efflux permease
LSSPPTPPSSFIPTRAIAVLAFAAFASQAMVRVADPLLPQIAADIGTSVGAASVVTSAYALAHGLTQLLGMPLGDRFPKYALVALLCALSAIATAACGLSGSLTALGVARLACGLTAGMIIPLGMAFIADAIPYAQRQTILGRFLAGQISGLVAGQIIGGVVGDYLGWRAVFFVIAASFVAVAFALLAEMLRNPATRGTGHGAPPSLSLGAAYAAVLKDPWARIVVLSVLAESAIMFSAFAYIGADLHARLGLSFSAVGAVLAAFGAGGLAYVLSVKILVDRLGQPGLVIAGGIMLSAAFLALAVIPVWWIAFLAVAVIGLAFHMVHNTLQVNATQMTPQARSTAIGLFAAAFYFGQSAGVAGAAPIVDRFGAAPVFALAALLWLLLALVIVMALRRRPPP